MWVKKDCIHFGGSSVESTDLTSDEEAAAVVRCARLLAFPGIFLINILQVQYNKSVHCAMLRSLTMGQSGEARELN